MDQLSARCLACPRLILASTSLSREILRWPVIIACMKPVLFASAVILGGCDTPDVHSGVAKLPANIVSIHHGEFVLRARLDTARNRAWVLTVDHVAVYDGSTKQLIRHIELPPWSVAALVCQPDITFDAQGTAFISHNLEPKLWQIDGDTFILKEHTVRLLGREHLDIGFTNLAVESEGTLTAEASSGGSLWRIDLQSATAHRVENARVRGCAAGQRGEWM